MFTRILANPSLFRDFIMKFITIQKLSHQVFDAISFHLEVQLSATVEDVLVEEHINKPLYISA